MARYFIIRARPVRAEDDDYYPTRNSWFIPTVSDHEGTDTGLVDQNGNAIMRAPRPMGFGRDDEW